MNDLNEEDMIGWNRTIRADDDVFNLRPFNASEKRKVDIALLRLESKYGTRHATFKDQIRAGAMEGEALKKEKIDSKDVCG